MKRLLIAALALLTIAAATPPVVTVPNVTFSENAPSAAIDLFKPKASSYSKVRVQTVDGTAKANVDYHPIDVTLTLANTVLKVEQLIPLIDNATYQGTRSFTIKLTCVRFCTLKAATATVTITDDETPPPAVAWVKCADENGTCNITGTADVRYGSGTVWTAARSVTGSVDCSNGTWGDPLVGTVKECDTDGTPSAAPAPAPVPTPAPTPVPAPSANPCFIYDPATKSQVPLAGSFCPAKSCPGYPNPVPYQDPCPVVTSWVPAPLQVGGYARLRNGPSLIVRLVATGDTDDADPALRTHWWATEFQQDASGNYPIDSDYWRHHIAYNFDAGLEGVAPAQ